MSSMEVQLEDECSNAPAVLCNPWLLMGVSNYPPQKQERSSDLRLCTSMHAFRGESTQGKRLCTEHCNNSCHQWAGASRTQQS